MAFAQEAAKVVPEVDAVLSDYRTTIAVEVLAPHEDAVKSLNAQYLAALDRQLESAQQQGRLDDALGLKAEREAVVKGPFPPEKSEGEPKGALTSLRKTYLGSLSGLEVQRESNLRPHRDRMLKALDGIVLKLTQEGRLEEALAAKERRDAEASATSKGIEGKAAPAAPVPAAPSVAPSPEWDKLDRFFVNESWYSIARAEYRFDRDGKGERIHGGVTLPFTWERQPDGLVKIDGKMRADGGPVIWYFKFDNRDTALFGTQPNAVKDPLTSD